MDGFDFDFLDSKIKNGIISEQIADLLIITSHHVLLKLKLKNSTENYLNFSKLLKNRAKEFEWSVSETLDYQDSLIGKAYQKSADRLESVSNNWVF
jgi:hypothetical protein